MAMRGLDRNRFKYPIPVPAPVKGESPCSDPDVTIRVDAGSGQYAIVKSGPEVKLQYVVEAQASLEILETKVREIFKFDQAMQECCLQAIDAYRSKQTQIRFPL